VQIELDHPSDDPSLPSYQHPALRDLAVDLRRAYDTYHCLRGVKEQYLPQESAEPDKAYTARLDRAVFSDFFRQSIHAFAGVLSKFQLHEPPATFEDAADNIDLEGNSLTAWFQEVDALMLRDGGIVLQVEMPATQPATAGQEARQGRRPYLISRSRSKVLNWRVSVTDGVEALERVTLLESTEVEDGEFGVKLEPRYRVISRGAWQLFKIERNSSNDLVAILEDKDAYLAAGGQPLPVVPCIWYSSDQAGFGHGELPLRQVVEHSIEHFQKRSDLSEKTHKCAMPVPVRTGVPPNAKPLVLGPNSHVDLPNGGTFTFAEPSASSLAEQRQQIADVEQLIARQTLGFLYGDPGAVKTATQAGMEGAQTENAVARIAERKRSAMQSIMKLWTMFTGEELSEDAGIIMADSIYERPLEAQDITLLQQLTGGESLVSRRSAIEELQRAGRLSATTSVDDELKRLKEEEPEPADDVDLNDLGSLRLPPMQEEPET
jgi:hypothetical protein